MDVLTKAQRAKNMRAIKCKGSKIETILGRALWYRGYRYRKNDKKIIGKPDFTLKKYKIAIFCDSEYFHGKDWETQKHRIKTNVSFWHNKIEKTIKRDKYVTETLKNEGWKVLRFWGTDILRNTEKCIEIVEQAITDRNNEKIY